jgi:hypothetical protein
LHRQGGTLIDLDRDHVGVSAEVDYGPGKIWGEFSYARGTENNLPVEGVGGDVTMMYVLGEIRGARAVDLAPRGLRDGHRRLRIRSPPTIVDSAKRGCNDNQDKYSGVASFNYYGEMDMAADLTNMKVFTSRRRREARSAKTSSSISGWHLDSNRSTFRTCPRSARVSVRR